MSVTLVFQKRRDTADGFVTDSSEGLDDEAPKKKRRREGDGEERRKKRIKKRSRKGEAGGDDSDEEGDEDRRGRQRKPRSKGGKVREGFFLRKAHSAFYLFALILIYALRTS